MCWLYRVLSASVREVWGGLQAAAWGRRERHVPVVDPNLLLCRRRSVGLLDPSAASRGTAPLAPLELPQAARPVVIRDNTLEIGPLARGSPPGAAFANQFQGITSWVIRSSLPAGPRFEGVTDRRKSDENVCHRLTVNGYLTGYARSLSDRYGVHLDPWGGNQPWRHHPVSMQAGFPYDPRWKKTGIEHIGLDKDHLNTLGRESFSGGRRTIGKTLPSKTTPAQPFAKCDTKATRSAVVDFWQATRRPKVFNIAGDLRSAIWAGSETLAEPGR